MLQPPRTSPRLILLAPVGLLALAALLAAPGAAHASGFGLFQHGGRATGQAGAFTARASDPSALYYNPAAITRLPGLQLEAGLDFNNATDEYNSSTGSFRAHHIINFPPHIYLTWHLPNASPVALGLGIDAPFWQDTNWDPVFFPARFRTRRFELQVAEVHPVVAFELDEAWSIGGGLRYVKGTLRQDDNQLAVFTNPSGPQTLEIERSAKSDVDGLGWDLALHYTRPAWGWGAVLRSEVKVDGSGDARYTIRNAVAGTFPLADGSASQSFELPYELRSGLWWAPYPELRLEADLAYQRWSGLNDSQVSFHPDSLSDSPVIRRRSWDDTLGVRLGLEGNVTDNFILSGGIAFEPSPVPDDTLEPGFPRGDATVYAAGFTYNFPAISFDIGYSFHNHDDRDARRQERVTAVNSTYTAHDQVWAASVRWRF